MIKLFFFISLFFYVQVITAQDTIFNAVDLNGQKTGFWKSYYENGRLRYRGYFLNGTPVGEMVKYYPDGLVQAKMNFDPSGKISYVKLFNEQGKLVAEGKYFDKLKDSTWNYYSPDHGKLILSESFLHGKKNGISYKYYQNGKISELIEWNNDSEFGKWEQYYENGDLRLKCAHSEGKRSGIFQSFYPGKIISISGEYKNGLMNGKWTYFNEKGEFDLSIEYIDGLMLPNKEYDKRAYEFSRKVEEAIGNFKELDEIELQ